MKNYRMNFRKMAAAMLAAAFALTITAGAYAAPLKPGIMTQDTMKKDKKMKKKGMKMDKKKMKKDSMKTDSVGK